MFACLSRRHRHLNTSAWQRRITAALAAAAFGLLAWAAAVPAASAKVLPADDFADYEPARAATGTVWVITTGGMPGWQIALIVVAAALAAAAAVFLDRARASRRSAPSAG